MKIEITELTNGGDARGLSFMLLPAALAALGKMADLHLASTGPQAVRGNHYHVSKRELIVVLPGATWSLHWDEGQGTAAQSRKFNGENAVLVQVPRDARMPFAMKVRGCSGCSLAPRRATMPQR